MSSSDEDAVRRPGRGAGRQSPSGSERSNTPAERNQSPVGSDAGNMNVDDDADLFGSDGSDDGLENLEYGFLFFRLEGVQYADNLASQHHRTLDDEQLDSGDDEGRDDRRGDRMDYEDGGEGEFPETVNIMDLSLGRAPEPATTNGEVGER